MSDPTSERDPWERWSWVMAAIWLVFLGFPLVAMLQADAPLAARATGVAALVAFAAVYVHGFVGMGGTAEAEVYRRTPRYLAILTGLAAIVLAVGGAAAIGVLVFHVSYAMFGLPLRWALVVVAGVTGAVVALPLILGDAEEMVPILPVVALVTAVCLITRVLESRGRVHHALQDEVRIVAERERVARDVHDVLGHSLTVVTVKAELAERLVDRDPARAKDEMAQVQSLAREALAEVRATVAGLRIARLGDELVAARAVLADAGIEAEVPDDASVVDPRHRLVLAWVLREAVTNVVRHSAAHRCEVRLSSSAMRVLDDGRGRCGPGGPVAGPGNGLRGVAERVRAAGGVLDVTDGPDGRGTVLEARWT